MLGQVLGQSIQKEQCTASLHFEEEGREKFSLKMMLQAPAYDEDGETIGMTTNSDVSSHLSPIFFLLFEKVQQPIDKEGGITENIYLSAGEDVQVSGGGEREATGSGFSSEKWLWKEGLYIPDASFLDDNICAQSQR